MSDTSQGAGWWLASDGKWYAPEQAPGYRPPPPPPPRTPVAAPPPVPPSPSSAPLTPATPPAQPQAAYAPPPAWTPPVPPQALQHHALHPEPQPFATSPPKKSKAIPILACCALGFLLLVAIAFLGSTKKEPAAGAGPAAAAAPSTTASAPSTTAAAPTTEAAPTTAASLAPVTSTTMSDAEISDLAFEITWDGLTDSEQSDLCLLWSIDPDTVLDTIASGWEQDSSSGPFPRSNARAFFSRKC